MAPPSHERSRRGGAGGQSGAGTSGAQRSPGKRPLTQGMNRQHAAAAIQRKADSSGSSAGDDPASQVTAALSGRGTSAAARAVGRIPTSGGAPVGNSVVNQVEAATGGQVGDVRVHTGAESAQAAHAVSARAFTIGNNIHLGAGQSAQDARLMAHEVTHTMQGASGAKLESGVSQPSDPLELEADRVADAAVSGGTAPLGSGGGGGGGGALMRDAADQVEDLLSYGVFDWAVTDSDATHALVLLSNLPAGALTSTLHKMGAKYQGRLMSNLPATAVMSASGPGLFRILCALPAGYRQALMNKLGKPGRAHIAFNLQHSDVTGAVQHRVIRMLFDRTPAAEIDTLQYLVAARFNLTVGSSSDKHGVAWDKTGLRRSWDVLESLPAAHIENNTDLSSLTRYRSTDIEGWADGAGEAAMGYGKKNHLNTDVEHGDYTDAKDPLRGKNLFDATVRHEIGHRVDTQVGGPAYEATDPGGGWLKWNDGSGMAERMVAASGGAISKWHDHHEKKAIIDCLQKVIDDSKPEQIEARVGALPFCAHHAHNHHHKHKYDQILADHATRALAVCFASQEPWQTGTGGVVLGERIYQEAYDGDEWVSYKHAARGRKVSRYQFRAPGEWFAEAYATYYQPPGKKGALLATVDAPTKAWFDANVDPQHGAGDTTPPKAEPGKDDGH